MIAKPLKWSRQLLEKNTQLLGSISSLVAIISFPSIFFGGWLAYYQIRDYFERPDVQLVFVHAKEVSVAVRNVSKRIVRDPQYQIAFWNLDAPKEQLMQPLPIPVKLGDFIRPGWHWGPNQLMSIQRVKNQLKKGDRIFGFAFVTCPDCAQTRWYWVYFEHGSGGWYAEATNVGFDVMRNLLNLNESIHAIDELVPEEQRIPIR